MEWMGSFQGGEFGNSRYPVIFAAVEISPRIPLWIVQGKEPTKTGEEDGKERVWGKQTGGAVQYSINPEGDLDGYLGKALQIY